MPNVTWFSQDLRILHKLWGGPPGPRGSPWTRFSPTESASSAQGKPTRASAADQGVRPTINADCPILTKPSDIGHSARHSACHVVFEEADPACFKWATCTTMIGSHV